MPRPFDERIASALKVGSRAADVQQLADDLESERAALVAQAEAAHRRSLDTSLDSKAARAARDQAKDLEFEAERRAAQRDEMRAHFEAKTKSDKARQQREEYEAAAAEADALVTEIRDRVPIMLAELAALFQRIVDSDERLKTANAIRPGGSPWLAPVEARARGFAGNGMWPDGVNHVKRLVDLQLPNFDTWGLLWDAKAYGRGPTIDYVAILEQTKRDLVAREEAARNRWKPYRLEHRSGAMLFVGTRDGVRGIDNEPRTFWMDDAQVEDARSKRIKVTPAPEPAEAAE
ncbi:MAG: hypothetical protein GC201_16350 [Alphaproteobacteria bacterium]|nr:hypothetical protein [Alphaproteobacteria bacterium]